MLKSESRIYTYLKKHLDFQRKGEKLGLSKSDYFNLLRYPGGYSQRTTIKFTGATTHFTSPYWLLHSIQEIFVDEVYKFSPTRVDPRIIDCGANIGLAAIYFKRLCPGARVIAFEPDPTIFELLQANLHERGYDDVEIINRAVWIEETVRRFEREGNLGGRFVDGTASDSEVSEVNANRLRDYLNEEVEFLKIDIEGAEYDVLRDCADRLGNVANLFVEYHVRPTEEQRLDEILLWIRNAGFRYYISEAAKNQLHPFVIKRGGVYDMQLNISCYRP
jgi:FkbM family methyltransferase